MKASAAEPFASSAEPALNPNQPNHSIEAPIIVIVRLCGVHRFLAVADALAEHDRADQAGDTGVDVHHGAAREVERAPSARSNLLCALAAVSGRWRPCTRPDPPRTRPCARRGCTLNVNQITMNSSTAENLTRSTSDPRIRQHVIAANVAWKATNTSLVHRRRFAERRTERERARRRIEHAVQEQPRACYRRTRCRR